ncbi:MULTISPECIES: ribose-phosphate diphosphokinase [Methylosinus]|uniref:ribose-phosphate diphosphokinase n=1 Tax=Methylosinus trichosporium (strain ATCC 35070 / NCIMB 11131 / UNIQEM 75 / OB3b) TaxID=595536 RepID=A0A2D2D0K6_METT3|nr:MULTISPECIES: ribose-phosphate diphosphokinase [Methylosinus]ATQ68527.1 ribose-phosphate pyrophosphokinase [Methylosinus trichosporium OB3b]
MTTLAMTQPFLRRLFERLDSAPQPVGAEAERVLAQWRAARRGVAPPLATWIASPRGGFVFRKREGQRDYELLSGAEALAPLLSSSESARLSACADRRAAVRLRRLFDEALRIGEPVLAIFTLVEQGRDIASVELIAAPLALADGALGAVAGALSVSRFIFPAPARPMRAPAQPGLVLFALGSSATLGEQVAREIGIELSPHEERRFEDGERKIRPLADVRGRDVQIVTSLHGEAGETGADKLLRLLFFIGALRDAGAAKTTAITPYLCYARKDRRTKPRDPVTTRMVAQLLEAIGADAVVTIDAHNVAAFENAFRIEAVALDAQALLARHFVQRIGDAPAAVVSPDLGGEKRAELFRLRLEATLGRPIAKAFMDKHRSMGQVSGEIFAGDVAGRTAIVLDDLISGGGTMARAAAACRANGAARILLAATHGLFARGGATLRDVEVDEIVVTDCVPIAADVATAFGAKLTVLGVAPLLARAIERLHGGGSIDDLLERGP